MNFQYITSIQCIHTFLINIVFFHLQPLSISPNEFYYNRFERVYFHQCNLFSANLVFSFFLFFIIEPSNITLHLRIIYLFKNLIFQRFLYKIRPKCIQIYVLITLLTICTESKYQISAVYRCSSGCVFLLEIMHR